MKKLLLFLTLLLTMLTSFSQTENEKNKIQQTINNNEKKLKRNPDDLKALSKIAISHYKLKDLQTAISYYDRIIAINTKYAGALANRGMCKLFLGDKMGACSDFQQSITNGENPKIIENKPISEYVSSECRE
jgi:tetratricopeptide (TPR) repeat protein